MSARTMDLVAITRAYYDSADADNFYAHIWGGEDIHIGLFETSETDIARASRRTVDTMAARLPDLGPAIHVLDLGSGYGGPARHLARTTGCRVTALNLSATENARARALCAAAGLDDLVTVVEGSYEAIPLPDASVDVAWSQDALLHSARKPVVFAEVARVLRPGGTFLFTDPMESDHVARGAASRAALQPVLERIHLSEMGSFVRYRELAAAHGFEVVAILDLSSHLPVHYAHVRRELARRRGDLRGLVSPAFVDRMLAGLDQWVTAGERGLLAWGILHLHKPAG